MAERPASRHQNDLAMDVINAEWDQAWDQAQSQACPSNAELFLATKAKEQPEIKEEMDEVALPGQPTVLAVAGALMRDDDDDDDSDEEWRKEVRKPAKKIPSERGRLVIGSV